VSSNTLMPQTFVTADGILQSKYALASSWADWARNMLNTDLVEIKSKLGSDTVATDLSAVAAALDAITLYSPTGEFTYDAPTAPTYTTVPSFTPQTLGTIHEIPAVADINIPDVPSTTVSFTNSAFTDDLLTSLRNRLEADITTASTGLGSAEDALFARETARQNSARAQAYTEATTIFSSRGFDMPPGALSAKQTEMNNESGIRLSDSSSQIMAESARLAVDYNKAVLASSTQLLDLLSRVFDSKIMRDFDAAKTQVTLNLEGFKSTVSVALAKADINKTAILATVQANQGVVDVFKAELAGQIEPMKAIAETNQAVATSYDAAVKGAVASLQAQTIPEELKLKGVQANASIGGTKAEIALKEANVVIETALRQLTLEVSTLQGLAQSAAQMIASSLNSVSVSSSFGWSASTSSSESENLNVTNGDVSKSQNISA